MNKFLGIAITTITLITACGDNQSGATAAGSTTDAMNTSSSTDGSSSTQHANTDTSVTGTDGMSGASTNPPTTDGATGDSTPTSTSSSTGEACMPSIEGCACGFNDFCENPDNVCLDGTCTCPTAQHGCSCSPGGACAEEGDVCFEDTQKCLGCEAVDNPYCTINCGPPDTVQVKEFPNDVGFPWAMCAIPCPTKDGQLAPEDCPKPEGFAGAMKCMQDTPWGDICYASCNTDTDCPHANHCLDWGSVHWCMGDNPYDKQGAPLTLEPDYSFSTNTGKCTAETCMSKN